MNGFMSGIYTAALVAALAFVLGGSHLLDETVQEPQTVHADRLCQAQHGPQVAHAWVDGMLMCVSVRGEIVNLREF